ncbi:monocarboxylate transporter 3-like [Mercenaria mercenaria]|uniref:monocarboxylate transporter 3-like n=1 Tax=Mercenaria mercenaria TaxID=6596 RepID=UPI00234ED198|nr:monocarboxylate transporter 3-like [Mercenaria mercenaria]XP_045207944.2 monocarboxylate transporter 3-like [Mercenaria mercenaria]
MPESASVDRTSPGRENKHDMPEARVTKAEDADDPSHLLRNECRDNKTQIESESEMTGNLQEGRRTSLTSRQSEKDAAARNGDTLQNDNETRGCEFVSDAGKQSSVEELPLIHSNGDNRHVNINSQNDFNYYNENKNGGPNGKALERGTSCYDNAPDGGWGWVVTFAAFMVGVILDGISFSFGIFFKELLVYFKESKSLTSWIISVLNGTYLGIGPISSIMVSVFGCRQVAVFGALLSAVSFFACTWSPNVQVMIILYGLLGGAGLGLLYLPSIVTVGHYFKKRRALATGIAVCGSGIGGFVFAPLSEFLIEKYTWKGAMWIISAIVLNGIPIAILLRPLEGSEEEDKRRRSMPKGGANTQLLADDTEDCEESKLSKCAQCCDVSSMFDFELLRSPTFLVYGLSCFLCMLGFFIPFTYIPDLADEFGMTSQQGAMLISIIGILNTVARVLVGWLADRPWADPLKINSVALLIGGVATMFVPYYSHYGAMSTYCVVFGISIAVFVSYRSIIMAELLGIEKLTSSFGLVTMCQGLSAFIGAPIAGALSDEAGDYEGAFYLAGAAIALSGAICFPLRAVCRWENRRQAKIKTTTTHFELQHSDKAVDV